MEKKTSLHAGTYCLLTGTYTSEQQQLEPQAEANEKEEKTHSANANVEQLLCPRKGCHVFRSKK